MLCVSDSTFRLVCGDLLGGVGGPFDAVLANLPYVAEGLALPPEISRYEPPSALFAGPDGLDVIRRPDGLRRWGADWLRWRSRAIRLRR